MALPMVQGRARSGALPCLGSAAREGGGRGPGVTVTALHGHAVQFQGLGVLLIEGMKSCSWVLVGGGVQSSS